eukprot:851175_1
MRSTTACEIILTPNAIQPNLKHLTKCMKYVLKQSQQQTEFMEINMGLNKSHKEKESKLHKIEQKLHSRELDLSTKEKSFHAQLRTYKQNKTLLENEKEILQKEQDQQKQLTLILTLQARKNQQYAIQLKQRESDLLKREENLMQRSHDLYTKEKELLQKEHKNKFTIKTKRK